MESRVSYAAVGAFVLILGTALIGMGLWLGSDITVRRYDHYSIYFEESVSGLYANAPVKYRGVVVGRVDSIELADANPERVHVVVAVQEGTPVKTDTRAKLDPQGVTGVVHVELTGGTRAAPPLASRGGSPHPVIESEPSLLTRLDQALTDGLQTLDTLATQVSGVLSDGNQKNLQQTLENLAVFSRTLASNGERLERALTNVEQMTATGAAATAELPATVKEARATLAEWRELATQLEEVGTTVGAVASSSQREIDQIGRTTMPEVNALISEMRMLADNLGRLAEDLRDNPRMLLFGRSQGEPGPGE